MPPILKPVDSEDGMKFIIYSNRQLWTVGSTIFHILNGNGEILNFDYERDITPVWENMNLYNMGLWQYLLGSKDREYLHSMKPKLQENGVDVFAEFEKDGVHYLVLYKPEQNGKIVIDTGTRASAILNGYGRDIQETDTKVARLAA